MNPCVDWLDVSLNPRVEVSKVPGFISTEHVHLPSGIPTPELAGSDYAPSTAPLSENRPINSQAQMDWKNWVLNTDSLGSRSSQTNVDEEALLFEELGLSKNESSPAMQLRQKLTCTTSQRQLPSNILGSAKKVRRARGGSLEDIMPRPVLHYPYTASPPRNASMDVQRPLPSSTSSRRMAGSLELPSGTAGQEGCLASRRRPAGMTSLMSSQELSPNTMLLSRSVAQLAKGIVTQHHVASQEGCSASRRRPAGMNSLMPSQELSPNTMSLSSGTDSRRRTLSMMKFLMEKQSRVSDQGTPWGCARMVANMSASSRRLAGSGCPTASVSSLPSASVSTLQGSVDIVSFSCGQMNVEEEKNEEGRAANERSSQPARVVKGPMEGGNGLVEKEEDAPLQKEKKSPPAQVVEGTVEGGNGLVEKEERALSQKDKNSLPAQVVEGLVEGCKVLVEKEEGAPIQKKKETSLLSELKRKLKKMVS